ncbi:hypothetical protein [Parvibaculum sp.]|uniref:hypothetical protein n=1 Tax=Parvibaculum sp. TaxID=2024848 RepID=UPI0034886500
MDQIDTPTLFAVNLVLALILATFIWGASALLVAALAGTPIALGTIVMLSLTAKA